MAQCRPILWLPMALPIGVSTGFVSVALANALARSGLAESVTADFVATFFLALTLGVLWGPAIDASLTRRHWVVIGVLTTAVGLFALTILPSTSAKTTELSLIAFVTGTGAIIVGLASKGIIAYAFPTERRAVAGAWYAAGNFAGASIAGALGVLWLASTLSRALVATTIASSVLVTLLAVLWLPRESIQPARGTTRRLAASLSDVWRMLREPKGKVALALCILPFGSGAAINLMPSGRCRVQYLLANNFTHCHSTRPVNRTVSHHIALALVTPAIETLPIDSCPRVPITKSSRATYTIATGTVVASLTSTISFHPTGDDH